MLACELVRTQRIAFQTRAGVSLVGTFVPPKRLRAPAVLLLHMLGRDRGTFDALLAPLHEAGFALMTVDFRGHGESSQGPHGWEKFSAADWTGLLEDAHASLDVLRKRREVDGQQLAIIGASIGANVAALTAAADASLRAVVLLSPGLDYKGVVIGAAVAKMGARPTVLVAAQGDTYAFDSGRQLVTAAPEAEFATLAGDAHGTNMFTAEPKLVGRLVAFLQRALPTEQ